MPTESISTPKPADAELVFVCDLPFASEFGTATRDMRLRGDHPLVRQCPEAFSPDGTLEQDRKNVFQIASDLHEADEEMRKQAIAEKRLRQAAANRVRLVAPDVLVAKDDLVCEIDDHPATLAKGSTLLATDPIVAQFPDAFEPAKR